MRDHSFSTYAKFSEKLTLFSPWYAHLRGYAHLSGDKNCWFFGKFCVRSKWMFYTCIWSLQSTLNVLILILVNTLHSHLLTSDPRFFWMYEILSIFPRLTNFHLFDSGSPLAQWMIPSYLYLSCPQDLVYRIFVYVFLYLQTNAKLICKLCKPCKSMYIFCNIQALASWSHNENSLCWIRLGGELRWVES